MKKVAVGIIIQNGLVLVCQRPKTGKYPLKWEFPGGKIEPGETGEAAVVRELHEELAIHAVVEAQMYAHEWVYRESQNESNATGRFQLSYFLIRSFTGEPVNLAFNQILWVTPLELLGMDILEGNRNVIEILVRRTQEGHEAA